MKGQKLKIIFIEDMAFLTRDVILDFTQVKISDRPGRFKSEAYWTVRVIDYSEKEKWLHVEVLKYHVGSIDFSSDQLQLEDQLSEVEKVTFEDIDPSGLHLTLNGTSPLTYKSPQRKTIYGPQAIAQMKIPAVRGRPVVKTCQEPFSIAIKDVAFHNGFVWFEKNCRGLNNPFPSRYPMSM